MWGIPRHGHRTLSLVFVVILINHVVHTIQFVTQFKGGLCVFTNQIFGQIRQAVMERKGNNKDITIRWCVQLLVKKRTPLHQHNASVHSRGSTA